MRRLRDVRDILCQRSYTEERKIEKTDFENLRECCRYVIRYVFWGGCTTLVNLVSFYIMRLAKIPLMTANVISIILAILFAYIVNSRFVFHDYTVKL